jgi:hypothetical protein
VKKIVHFLQDNKSPFCDHPFPVVTKREISDLCENISRGRRQEENEHLKKEIELRHLDHNTSFFCVNKEGGHGVTNVKSLFCEHAFAVVTKKGGVSLPRKEDIKSLFWDHPFPVVHLFFLRKETKGMICSSSERRQKECEFRTSRVCKKSPFFFRTSRVRFVTTRFRW